MTRPVPDGTSSWSAIPWSEIPARYRESPHRWPEPRKPSDRRVFWWRVASVLAVVGVWGFSTYLRESQSGPGELGIVQTVSLWLTGPLSSFFGAAAFMAATWPRFEHVWQIAELNRTTRVARKETLRAIRRGAIVPPDRAPLARFWIDQQRSQVRPLCWAGLFFVIQMTLSITQTWWITAWWLAAAVAWLGFTTYSTWTLRSYALWEASAPPRGGAG